MNKYILSSLLCVLLISCSNQKKEATDLQLNSTTDSAYVVKYAQGFDVNLYNGCKQVIVKDPWDSTKVLQKYVLIDRDLPLPSNLPEGIVVRTPLKNVVAYSAIQCSTIGEIGMIETIKGVCEPQYIDIPFIKTGIEKGSIENIGQSSNPNKELIIAIEPEAVFIEPIPGSTTSSIQDLGITVIETPDYMEPTPLGRAEWIRFYSLFYNQEELVDSLFDETVKNYNDIKTKVANVSYRPTVFFDLMYRGVWYVSGGDSFIAKMMDDAGASYVWKDNANVDVNLLSFEQVLDKAANADFWLIKYNGSQMYTYKTIENENKMYNSFDAFKNKNIYVCNTAKNTYFQDLPIHPDYILKDFASVFHPELFPDYQSKYYFPIQ